MTDQQDRRLSAQLREAAQEMRKQERGAHAEAIERAPVSSRTCEHGRQGCDVHHAGRNR